jgi:Tfp pilus assembly protein PilF
MTPQPTPHGSGQTAADAIRLAFAHHLAGRRAEAEAICRRVLEREPRHAGALHLLAVMAHAQKRLAPALELVRKAVAAAPRAAGYRNTVSPRRTTGYISFLAWA